MTTKLDEAQRAAVLIDCIDSLGPIMKALVIVEADSLDDIALRSHLVESAHYFTLGATALAAAIDELKRKSSSSTTNEDQKQENDEHEHNTSNSNNTIQ